MRLIFVLLVSVLFAACAPVVTATERGGIVSKVGGWNRSEAVAAANSHCEKSQRTARILATDALDSSFTFDCVE